MFEHFWLLVLSVALGWVLLSKKRSSRHSNTSLAREYYDGLSFLLNEETDKAIAAFIKLLDNTNDSVDTSLAIGCFFRKRGEVDKAIRLHQSLIAKPSLHKNQRYRALLELAYDYIAAGVYDRAEVVLIEITQANVPFVNDALKSLLDIYEREKEWHKAIEVAKRLSVKTRANMQGAIAHYYCECAQNAWNKGKVALAFRYLKRGQAMNPKCARVLFLRGEYELRCHHIDDALKSFKAIPILSQSLLSEAVNQIITCYEKKEDTKGLYRYLEWLYSQSKNNHITLALVKITQQQENPKRAQELLYQHLTRYPSLEGLELALSLQANPLKGVREMHLIESVIKQLNKKEQPYACSSCGLRTQTLYWQCPSCHHWDTIRAPILEQHRSTHAQIA